MIRKATIGALVCAVLALFGIVALGRGSVIIVEVDNQSAKPVVAHITLAEASSARQLDSESVSLMGRAHEDVLLRLPRGRRAMRVTMVLSDGNESEITWTVNRAQTNLHARISGHPPKAYLEVKQ